MIWYSVENSAHFMHQIALQMHSWQFAFRQRELIIFLLTDALGIKKQEADLYIHCSEPQNL